MPLIHPSWAYFLVFSARVNWTEYTDAEINLESERRRIAQDLIVFDHKFSRLSSGRPTKDVMDEAGISMEEFKDAFDKDNMFVPGVAIDYGASIIVAKV